MEKTTILARMEAKLEAVRDSWIAMESSLEQRTRMGQDCERGMMTETFWEGCTEQGATVFRLG